MSGHHHLSPSDLIWVGSDRRLARRVRPPVRKFLEVASATPATFSSAAVKSGLTALPEGVTWPIDRATRNSSGEGDTVQTDSDETSPASAPHPAPAEV